MEFASRARAIKSKAKCNVQRSIEELERIVKGLQKQVDSLVIAIRNKGLDPVNILDVFIKNKNINKEIVSNNGKIVTKMDENKVNDLELEQNNFKIVELNSKIDALKETHQFEIDALERELEASKDPNNHQLVQKIVENCNEKTGV